MLAATIISLRANDGGAMGDRRPTKGPHSRGGLSELGHSQAQQLSGAGQRRQ